jgi:hypothetical protein
MRKSLISRLKGRRLAALTLAALTVLVFAAVALAVKPHKGVYSGTTGQGKSVEITVNKKHRIKKFTIGWTATCDKPGKVYSGSTQDIDGKNDKIEQPGDGSFSDKGSYTESAGIYKGHVKVELGGTFDTATAATGTFKVHVRVTYHGQFVDKCHKTTHWHVP